MLHYDKLGMLIRDISSPVDRSQLVDVQASLLIIANVLIYINTYIEFINIKIVLYSYIKNIKSFFYERMLLKT